MSDTSFGTIMACFIAAAMIIVTIFLVIPPSEYLFIDPSENRCMTLGDEVSTTDEYTMFFNDSFSGRIVSIGGLYTVRDENGTERVFAWKWIDHVDTLSQNHE